MTTQRLGRRADELRLAGYPYSIPSDSRGFGWKIHLSVERDVSHPLTRAVAEFLAQHQILFKIGGGAEEGKGMTTYVGDRDLLETLARELAARFDIPAPVGTILRDDLPICGAVWARFDPGYGDGFVPYSRVFPAHGLPGLGSDGLHEIASELRVDLRHAPLQLIERALTDRLLRKRFGALYEGTDEYPSHTHLRAYLATAMAALAH